MARQGIIPKRRNEIFRHEYERRQTRPIKNNINGPEELYQIRLRILRGAK